MLIQVSLPLLLSKSAATGLTVNTYSPSSGLRLTESE